MDLELSSTASSLSTVQSEREGHVIVALRGECDIVNAHVLRDRLLELVDGKAPRVVLDLSGLAFIDASGITALIVADERARELGATLILAAARNAVARVLSLTDLDQLFPVYATVSAAVADAPHADRLP